MVNEAIAGGILPRGFSSTTQWPWPLVKARELVTLNYGKALLETTRQPGDIPVYGTNGICGWSNRELSSGPGVILGRKGQGPLGVEWCDSPFWVIDTAYYVTIIDDRLRLRFFYNLVKFIGLNHLKDGTSNPSLSRDTFAQLLLPLPPIAVQDEISRILEELDRKIELNENMRETLSTMSQMLFQSWFVNFDPVHAKAEGRDPGVPAEMAQLLPDTFEDSSIGLIPAGWATVGLDEIGTFLNGLALQKYPAEDGDSLPAIKISQLRSENTEGADRVSKHVPIQYRVQDGDVLFSWSGSLECVIWTSGPGALNQHLFKVTSEQFPKWFYLGWIRHHLPEFRRIAASKATTMGHIQRHHLHEALVAVPPATLIESVSTRFEALLELSISVKLQSRMLLALRDTLLPKLLSGQVRIGGLGVTKP
jgi:type I restriction enzyme S subunit